MPGRRGPSGGREHWTRPPVVPREPPPAWRATWGYRLVALIALALLVAGAVQLFRVLSGATAQDPGIGAHPAAVPAPAHMAHDTALPETTASAAEGVVDRVQGKRQPRAGS